MRLSAALSSSPRAYCTSRSPVAASRVPGLLEQGLYVTGREPFKAIMSFRAGKSATQKIAVAIRPYPSPAAALSEVWLMARLTILICIMLNPKEGGGFNAYVLLSLMLAGLGVSADGAAAASDDNTRILHVQYSRPFEGYEKA